MKKIVIITLMLIVSTFKVDASCVELTIDKHIGGDPICRLNSGQTLEICLDEKTVRGGSCTFYIIGVEDNVNGMTLLLALDKVYWAPKYAELMINTVTQRMGFLLTHSNNTGVYSYFNESQIKQIRKSKEIEEIKKDAKLKSAIRNLIIKKDHINAKKLYYQLYNSDNNLLSEIEKIEKLFQRNEDISITKNISDFILKNDYKNAKNAYDQLNFSNNELLSKIENIKKENQQEIISLIASNQLTLALEKCDGLDETTDEINRLIVPRLTERYRDTLIYIEKEKAINLIKNNFESKLSGLKDGTYKLVISNTGNLSIYQNLNIIISNQLKMDEVMKLKIHSFEIPVNSEFIFEITSTTINLSVKDYTSTIDFDTEKNPSVTYLKNQDIPKGKFWKMQVVQNDKNIGDVRLSSSESLKFISEHKLKKNHIIRNAIIFGVIYIGYFVVTSSLAE